MSARYLLSKGGSAAYREDVVSAIEMPTMRPVVVIDPEDREQVDRLIDAALAHGYQFGRAGSASMTDALRSLLAPPKPPEPTGKYAEVEDARGMLYFRDPKGLWRLADNVVTPRNWDDIDAVKVLSQGVTR